jgi:hypothetical protein
VLDHKQAGRLVFELLAELFGEFDALGALPRTRELVHRKRVFDAPPRQVGWQLAAPVAIHRRTRHGGGLGSDSSVATAERVWLVAGRQLQPVGMEGAHFAGRGSVGTYDAIDQLPSESRSGVRG